MVITVLLISLALFGQSGPNSCALHGTVLDTDRHPVLAAVVTLRSKNSDLTMTATTDADGKYNLPGVIEGTYTVRVVHTKFESVTNENTVLHAVEERTLDFVLTPVRGSQMDLSSLPEFFDQPQFTVAGVTDTTISGGHGSDTIVRNTEAMAKATASLGVEPSNSINKTTEDTLRKAVTDAPQDFVANHKLGKLLSDEGKSHEAIGYLAKATRLNPANYNNAYELARAYFNDNEYSSARSTIQPLLSRADLSPQDQAKVHHLSAMIAEKSGDPLQAVREYQLAAELRPDETDLFDWGSELLEHGALEAATDVFAKGKDLFPHSVRMLIGLGVTLYARGQYDGAVERLCQASDIDPIDSTAYLFLGKVQSNEQNWSEQISERLARFVNLQPESAFANYYYAVSLWKKHDQTADATELKRAQLLLEKATRLDPHMDEAYLRLGIVFADQQKFSQAIDSYQKSLKINPRSAEAHYRLAQVYRKAGESGKAEQEVQLYQQTSKETTDAVERQRREMKQFVFNLRDEAPVYKPQ